MKINIKQKLITIGFYIITGIFLLGVIILHAGLGGRHHKGNSLFTLIGFLVLLPFAIGFLVYLIKERKLMKNKKDEIERLKKYGDKIKIDLLSDVDISFCTHEKIEKKQTTRYGYEENRIIIEGSVVKVKILHQGILIKHEVNVQMETTKLKMFFCIKKETFLYLNPKDIHKKYLDLEFLEE